MTLSVSSDTRNLNLCQGARAYFYPGPLLAEGDSPLVESGSPRVGSSSSVRPDVTAASRIRGLHPWREVTGSAQGHWLGARSLARRKVTGSAQGHWLGARSLEVSRKRCPTCDTQDLSELHYPVRGSPQAHAPMRESSRARAGVVREAARRDLRSSISCSR